MPLQIPLPTAGPYTDIVQYVPLLISSIEGFLQARDVWATADYPQAYSYMEDLKAYLVENLPPVIPEYAAFATHWHSNSKVAAGSGLVGNAQAGQETGFTYRQVPAAINDLFQFEVTLSADTYDLQLLGAHSSGSGKINLYVDASLVATIDFYQATTNLNTLDVTTFAITESGVHQITCEVIGKNASSSGYVINITRFSIRPQ